MGNTDIFEAMAGAYDTPERLHIAKLSACAIREYIVDGKEKHAVDFGCGTGLVGLELVHDFQHLTFLDASPKMLAQVEKKLAAADLRNARTLCFDIEAGEESDLRADYIFMVQVLLHIQEFEPVLSRLYEALNPGGHLLIVDFDKNDNVRSDKVHNGFDQSGLTRHMKKIGYKDIQSKTFYSGKRIFMSQDASLFILDCKK